MPATRCWSRCCDGTIEQARRRGEVSGDRQAPLAPPVRTSATVRCHPSCDRQASRPVTHQLADMCRGSIVGSHAAGSLRRAHARRPGSPGQAVITADRRLVRVSVRPDPASEWWTTSDVAAYLELKVATVSAYRTRGQMPQPDMTVGRTHVWRPATIIEWHSGRKRVGVGGRPVAKQD